MLEEYGGEVITFRSSADIEEFLDAQVPAPNA
jgi:hypothetical protein